MRFMSEPDEHEIEREEAKEGEPSPAVGNDPAEGPQQGKRRRIVAPDPEDRPDDERE